jgi:hypothetical protein
MAKAPPISYGNTVKLKPTNSSPTKPPDAEAHVPSVAGHVSDLREPAADAGVEGRRRPMESRSDPTIVYLHPDGKYELKRYALARGPKVKVHDLLLEAIEEWAERHGISAPFRVPSERPRRTQ